MSVIDKLATSLGRKDEAPNIELARSIVSTSDSKAVEALISCFDTQGKSIQSDCIKVLYEIADQQPALVAPYVETLLTLLDSSNNRIQWGAMKALALITPLHPTAVHASLEQILAIAERGTVITRDNAVDILLNLYRVDRYTEDAFTRFISQLKHCPVNQLSMYAENAQAIIRTHHRSLFSDALTSRLNDIDKDSKRRRVEKVTKRAGLHD